MIITKETIGDKKEYVDRQAMIVRTKDQYIDLYKDAGYEVLRMSEE